MHGEPLPRGRAALHGLVDAVAKSSWFGRLGEAVVAAWWRSSLGHAGVLERRRADGGDRGEQLHVGGVEPGHALPAADHEPLLVVVADGKAHARSSSSRRRGADPRRPEHAEAPWRSSPRSG